MPILLSVRFEAGRNHTCLSHFAWILHVGFKSVLPIPFFVLNSSFCWSVYKNRAWILGKQNCLTLSGSVAGVVIFQVPSDNKPISSYLPRRVNKAAKISFVLNCSVLFVDSASLDEFERIVHANAIQIMNNNVYFSSFVSTRCTTGCCD